MALTVQESEMTLASNVDAAAHTNGVAALSGPPASFPTLTSAHTPDEVIARLLALAKRGKLAGFDSIEKGSNAERRHFKVLAFGHPYDRDIIATAHRTPQGSSITFNSKLHRKMPTIMIVTMVTSLWPGVWLTDSMLSTYFSWYPRQFWVTCAWYLPLTLAAIPVLWKQFKKSETLTHAEALEVIEKIAATIA